MNAPITAVAVGPWLLAVPAIVLGSFLLLRVRRALGVSLVLSLACHLSATRALRGTGIAPVAAVADGPNFEEFEIVMQEPVSAETAPASAIDAAATDGPRGVPDAGEHLAPHDSNLAAYLPAIVARTPGTRGVPTPEGEIPPIDPARWSGAEDASSLIRRRLLAAGGREGIVTVTLVWFTIDDLDLHVVDPTGRRICFKSPQPDRQKLDVDRNWESTALTNEPIENIRWLAADCPPTGTYRVYVDHFQKRTEATAKFLVRILIDGKLKALISRTVEFTSHDENKPEAEVYTFTYAGPVQ